MREDELETLWEMIRTTIVSIIVRNNDIASDYVSVSVADIPIYKLVENRL